eukprot:4015556-Amphidinium_carterae.1
MMRLLGRRVFMDIQGLDGTVAEDSKEILDEERPRVVDAVEAEKDRSKQMLCWELCWRAACTMTNRTNRRYRGVYPCICSLSEFPHVASSDGHFHAMPPVGLQAETLRCPPVGEVLANLAELHPVE